MIVAIVGQPPHAFSQLKDDKLEHLAATVYVRCLDNEGGAYLESRPVRKPHEYERSAKQACQKQENNLREALILRFLEAQIKSKNILNEAGQKVIQETVERSITDMRRGLVMEYAKAFDKKFPGLRGCTVVDGMKPDGPDYLCAIRD